ncbi:MAG: Fe-S protein assembly co-chaperone HscB [Deltaproteobacteria bacterium]|nr:Fe-S protein assembly co-chaperone HscB [Deltaproteobacteria bacterium]
MECKACQAADAVSLLCEACGAVQPPRPGLDKFTALGLPRTLALEPAMLEARYRELSRKLHPDRFVRAPANERLLSLQAATTLNEAYRTLRSPKARAEYLLSLEGIDIGEAAAVDKAFLMEIIALREELISAKEAGDEAKCDAMGADVSRRRDTALDAVFRSFARYEETRERLILDQIKEQLIAVRYFQRFIDEHEAGRED